VRAEIPLQHTNPFAVLETHEVVVGDRLPGGGTRFEFGESYDFSHRSNDLVVARLLLPTGAPHWALNPRVFWSLADTIEAAPDARLVREVVFDLPPTLDPDEWWTLARDFVRDEMVAKGMAADVAIHIGAWAGHETPARVHIVLTLRSVTTDGFGPVQHAWNSDGIWPGWKDAWARRCAEALAQAGRGSASR
jgi:hypothetical protein